MTIRTLTLAGLVALVTAPAFAGDGYEGQKNVYAGLRPAQTDLGPLESRTAVFTPERRRIETEANIRILDIHINNPIR